MARSATSVEVRFERYIEYCALSGCWLWSGAPDAYGYGRLWTPHGLIKAHRLSYTIHRGQIPCGLQVLHRCDTPACVNPKHLFLGTHAQNMADMDAKGRRSPHVPRPPSGDDHPKAVLTAEVVAHLRARERAEGRLNRSHLAPALGVSVSTLSRALTGKTWLEAHLDREPVGPENFDLFD